MKKLMIVLLVAGCASVAGAEPFWIAWEGNDYPENEGWTRYTRAGGADRSLHDGTMTLDSMADFHIVDEYLIYRPLVPGAGESFRMEWRMRVDELLGDWDPFVGVCSGDSAVFLNHSPDGIHSSLEGLWIDFELGAEFHDFALTSADMASYQLYVDGQLVHSGAFVGPVPYSCVLWGDATTGPSSISTWDYVRFGIVPEPGAGLLLGFAGLALVSRRAPRARRN